MEKLLSLTGTDINDGQGDPLGGDLLLERLHGSLVKQSINVGSKLIDKYDSMK